ncbi:MAG: hypothetical protein RLZZ216_739, partial [Cyanobacteriota bacterium]
RISETEACSALVPATPEALLRLMLDLEPQGPATNGPQRWRVPGPAVDRTPWTGPNPWTVVAWTSLAWMAVLGLTVAGFLGALERQDRKLDLLLERSGATSLPAHEARLPEQG